MTFLCKSGIGLPWFEENYKSGENFYKTISEMHGKKAVIWNFGINNLIDGLDDVGQRDVYKRQGKGFAFYAL